jgi:hypothetical protein
MLLLQLLLLALKLLEAASAWYRIKLWERA